MYVKVETTNEVNERLKFRFRQRYTSCSKAIHTTQPEIIFNFKFAYIIGIDSH